MKVKDKAFFRFFNTTIHCSGVSKNAFDLPVLVLEQTLYTCQSLYNARQASVLLVMVDQ